MTEVKHTHGPWYLPITGAFVAAPIEAGGYLICCMDSRETPVHEREANRRLIAAAPDLVEALLFFANPPTTSEYAWKQAKEKARAALAKAGVA